MMKTISIVGSVKIDLSNLSKGKANVLFRLLKDEGFILTTQPTGDYLIAIDHNQKMYNAFINMGGRSERTILLRLEPVSVFPAQYKKSLISKYGRVFSPGMLGPQYHQIPEFGWPYQYHLNPNAPNVTDPSLDEILQNPERQKIFQVDSWEKRPIILSMVAANKVSPTRSENYSLRRKVAKGISDKILQIYGPLWNDTLREKIYHRLAVFFFSLRQGTLPNLKSIYGNLFKNYSSTRGIVVDKHAILEKSKFSLVIENSNLCMTEKLFDALINGVIPIYIGPSLKELGLPSNLAFNSSGDPKEILEIIGTTNSNTVGSMLEASQNFLKSPIFKENWTEEAVYRKICTEITSLFKS